MTENRKDMNYPVSFLLFSCASGVSRFSRPTASLKSNKAILGQGFSQSISDLFFGGNVLKADLSFD